MKYGKRVIEQKLFGQGTTTIFEIMQKIDINPFKDSKTEEISFERVYRAAPDSYMRCKVLVSLACFTPSILSHNGHSGKLKGQGIRA